MNPPARALRPISVVGADLGFGASELIPYGPGIAKLPIGSDAAPRARRGRLVLVSAITPSEHGEGKTVTTIGLGLSLHGPDRTAVACLRQPSLGPVFGVKGGATGGGRATVEPSARINLGFTGDLRAIADAQNLFAAMIDNHLHSGNELGLDPEAIELPRTMDMGDRALRSIRVGAGKTIGPERRDRFVIAAASEVASVHQIHRDPADLRARLAKILAGRRSDGAPVRSSDLRAEGAMAALLADAIRPNLVQTCEGTPALVHAGPFANLGTGTASVPSIRTALARADYAIVEAGFATELGAEKFVDVVGPVGGFAPDAAVLVATVAGVKHQGGGTDLAALERGFPNLDRHIANLATLGIRAVVSLNLHPDDRPEEIAAVREHVDGQGVPFATSTVFRDGAAGGQELAARVVEAVERGSAPRPTSPPNTPWRERIERIATSLYGADGVQLAPAAELEAERLASVGLDRAPVVMAKTPVSLSDDPKRLGAPTGFTVTVSHLRAWGGVGAVVAELGPVLAMPGLPVRPQAEKIRLTDAGEVAGLG